MSQNSESPEQIHEAFLHAERLRTEPAFQAGMLALRRKALEGLVTVDATDIEAVRNAQATVRAIDGLTTELANAILRWKALPPAVRAQVSE